MDGGDTGNIILKGGKQHSTGQQTLTPKTRPNQMSATLATNLKRHIKLKHPTTLGEDYL